MIIIKIVILNFIQIRHTDDFPSTVTRLVKNNYHITRKSSYLNGCIITIYHNIAKVKVSSLAQSLCWGNKISHSLMMDSDIWEENI